MNQEEKVIMYDSPEAAKPATLTGWVNHKGFFHTNEHIVRYDGCTHLICECGNIMGRGWTKCEACIHKQRRERYSKMPFKEWDGETPLVIFDDDHYFFDEDGIEIYCEDHNCKSEDLELVICIPVHLSNLESDYWNDDLPEDGELPPAIVAIVKQLNEAIENEGPVSWTQGDYRTKVSILN